MTSADGRRVVDHVDRCHHQLNNARHWSFWSLMRRPIDAALGLQAEVGGGDEWEELGALGGGAWDIVEEEVRRCSSDEQLLVWWRGS